MREKSKAEMRNIERLKQEADRLIDHRDQLLKEWLQWGLGWTECPQEQEQEGEASLTVLHELDRHRQHQGSLEQIVQQLDELKEAERKVKEAVNQLGHAREKWMQQSDRNFSD